MYVNL
jgi:hypothetical protein